MDVRSSPYSRYASQFNKETIAGLLNNSATGPISYIYSGIELGGRPSDPTCYHPDGRVNYDRLAETDSFDVAVRRLIYNADERRIAIMCSEKEPLNCHRTLLIAQELTKRGVDVQHIMADGRLENHAITMNRLLHTLKLPGRHPQPGMRDYLIGQAVNIQAKKVGYVGRQPVLTADD